MLKSPQPKYNKVETGITSHIRSKRSTKLTEGSNSIVSFRFSYVLFKLLLGIVYFSRNDAHLIRSETVELVCYVKRAFAIWASSVGRLEKTVGGTRVFLRDTGSNRLNVAFDTSAVSDFVWLVWQIFEKALVRLRVYR